MIFAESNPINITDPASNHVVYIEAEGRVYTYLPQPCPCNRIGTTARGRHGAKPHRWNGLTRVPRRGIWSVARARACVYGGRTQG